MPRRTWMLLGAAAITAVASGSAAEAKRKGACERLRGADLAPARSIKLVRRGDDLVACVQPRGRVRTIASTAADANTQHSFDVLQVAGAFVLLRSGAVSPSAIANTVAVRNLRSSDSYEIAFSCRQSGGGDCGRGGRSSSALKVLINDRGQAAAAVTFAGSGATTISGFSRLGERRDYDSGLPSDIQPESLALAGSRASWTNSGQAESAQLPD